MHRFKEIMQEVYGEYISGEIWNPKLYTENKGRYLWTDSFGVCNFLTLFCETKEERYLLQADSLINSVHNVLGKDRQGKKRLGNATDEHPLLGGLRIGKLDDESMPNGDGQYFHYLTKWMFALNRMSIVRQQPRYNEWAIELAKSIHPKFIDLSHYERPRIYWKMSIDLRTPLVRSEGNLDPFDGLVVYRLLQESSCDKQILCEEISIMERIVNEKYKYYESEDPLDLGEALWIAHWYQEPWAGELTLRSLKFLKNLFLHLYFKRNSRYRLAFREFGTTIGLQVNNASMDSSEWKIRVQEVNNFWANQIYSRDSDITPVMYCTSLFPGVFRKGYLK